MNKELKKLSVTAEEIGHCLLCGGTHGNCSCAPALGSNHSSSEKRAFIDLCEGRRELRTSGKDGNADYHICINCGGIVAYLRCVRIVRCLCGNIIKHDFQPPVIPEPDYSVLDGLSELPRQATRKPKQIRSRSFPGSGNG